MAAAHARPAAANLLLLAGGVGGLAAVALLAAQPAWVVPAIALAVLVRYGIHQRRVARIVNGWRIGEEIAADDAVRAEDASMSLFVVVVTTTGALLWVWRAFAG